MPNFIFGRPDWQRIAEHQRRQAQQAAQQAQYWAGRERSGGFVHAQLAPRTPDVIDLVEIDGAWQLPPDAPIPAKDRAIPAFGTGHGFVRETS